MDFQKKKGIAYLPISDFPFFTFVVKAVFHSVKIFARADFLELKILRRKI